MLGMENQAKLHSKCSALIYKYGFHVPRTAKDAIELIRLTMTFGCILMGSVMSILPRMSRRDANLHRTDRMTMAHGLEACVPFLDTEFTRLVMSVDPAKKMVDPAAV
jgi:Asparagine synthase